MKKIFFIASLLFSVGSLQPLQAQETVKEAAKDVKHAGEKAGKSVKKGAHKVGRKTAEVASKGKARATDTEHKDKVGPNGENIYIDNHARYYWIDKAGKRHYVLEAELKNKTN